MKRRHFDMLTEKAIRQALRHKFGKRGYRINADGAIDACGPVGHPFGAKERGWYVWGYIGDRNTEVQIKKIIESM